MTTEYEQARLTRLRKLDLLDTPSSESFDRITRMASQLFDLPIAAVSLTDQDRQWFKSRVGVEHWEIPREKACCGEVADTANVLVVNDLLASDTYKNSLLAESGIRFYAGAPLMTRDGFSLGAMCVLGTEPREVSEKELAALQDLSTMVMSQIELQHTVGRVDSGTGLPNYLQFVEDLEDLARDYPDETYYALSTELIDLSEASTLQRVMGPSYLEDLSLAGSELMQEVLGENKRIYHIGPGQFAYIEVGPAERVLEQAQQLHQALLDIRLKNASPFMLRPVIGVAPFQLGVNQPGNILRIAHSASRDARTDECAVGWYNKETDMNHQRRFGLIANFADALEADDQLHLVYQPRLDAVSGKCLGAEALLRWNHSTLGAISPAEFVPLVEKTPLARGLTDWVLRQAIRQAGKWQREGHLLTVSVNIAAANLEEDGFCERLQRYLKAEQLPLTAIELELTESSLMNNSRAARRQLECIADSGLTLSIDDFGTGYSSLAYLQNIPAQIVKIDRSFIDGLEDKDRNQTLVRSMISMTHDLGYRVVAEGVETEEAYKILQSLSCDEVQGYWFARPLPINDFDNWISTRQQ
ncbi:EAL domain-containing protein [Pseudidiomarina sp.]|uniref:sensor domain-containing phosphodiesterase n=1 Tax=Pseudidiomarina sp. TaxID=2081707 RepID=UPI00299E6D64|nr:EAL domain-containing protein [Pseudidiomarina sp.]MDX1705420.1 EAL domain-containing protein [Pseudidiomarina sp.]